MGSNPLFQRVREGTHHEPFKKAYFPTATRVLLIFNSGRKLAYPKGIAMAPKTRATTTLTCTLAGCGKPLESAVG